MESKEDPNSLNIEVTRADPIRDSKDIAILIDVCRAEHRTVLDGYTAQEEHVYLTNLHARDAVFVARQDETSFAGFMSVTRRWSYSQRLNHCGEVGTWVIPAYRRQGVGTSLWQRGVLPWCHDHGFTHLGFVIMAHNADGIRFYERLGFRVCGYHRQVVNWDGKLLDAIEMELSLTR